jgi:hypothetical protein
MKSSKALAVLCQFPFADGRSCGMPRSDAHDYLCVFHADRERNILDQQALDANDLSDRFGVNGELRIYADLNAYFTRVAKHADAGRISPEILSSLVYAALQIQNLPHLQGEAFSAIGVDAWKAQLRRLYSSRSGPLLSLPSSPPTTS